VKFNAAGQRPNFRYGLSLTKEVFSYSHLPPLLFSARLQGAQSGCRQVCARLGGKVLRCLLPSLHLPLRRNDDCAPAVRARTLVWQRLNPAQPTDMCILPRRGEQGASAMVERQRERERERLRAGHMECLTSPFKATRVDRLATALVSFCTYSRTPTPHRRNQGSWRLLAPVTSLAIIFSIK
jgi:hypothetical protein